MRVFIILSIALLVLAVSLPVGKNQDSSEETTAKSGEDGVTTESEVSEITEPEEEEDIVEESEKRRKRGVSSGEKSEEHIEMDHGIHKRSAEHEHKEKRNAEHSVQSSQHLEEQHLKMKRNSDVHEHEKRHSDDTGYGHLNKRSADHERLRRNAGEDHMKTMLAKFETENNNSHVIQKRDPGQKSGGHRHSRSTDQGHDEDAINEESQSGSNAHKHRHRRNTDEESSQIAPTFASDVEKHDDAHSVAIRVKRVSRAGSSHKVRTLSKNRGNSKVGETSQSDNDIQTSFLI